MVGEAIENSSTSVMAVLSGECQPATFYQSILLNDLVQVRQDIFPQHTCYSCQCYHRYQISYSPNIGETYYSSGQLSFSSNSTIHMFPSQMRPTTVLALLEFYGWRKAVVLTEQNTQLEVNYILVLQISITSFTCDHALVHIIFSASLSNRLIGCQ